MNIDKDKQNMPGPGAYEFDKISDQSMSRDSNKSRKREIVIK